MENGKELKVTSVDEVKEKAGPMLVELPGWEDGDPFIARLRRIQIEGPILNALDIPNPLLNDLQPKGSEEMKQEMTKKLEEDGVDSIKVIKALNEIAKMSMVEPDPDEIFEYLTISQKVAIFNWQIGQVEEFSPFRDESLAVKPSDSSVPSVGDESVTAVKDQQ